MNFPNYLVRFTSKFNSAFDSNNLKTFKISKILKITQKSLKIFKNLIKKFESIIINCGELKTHIFARIFFPFAIFPLFHLFPHFLPLFHPFQLIYTAINHKFFFNNPPTQETNPPFTKAENFPMKEWTFSMSYL